MAPSLNELKENLAIDKSSLDDEIIRQPVLFYSISELLISANAERDAAKEQLATIDAELNAHYRSKLAKGDSRVTDNRVTSHIQIDKNHEEAFNTWLKAKTKAEQLQALKEAFQQRSYMLRDLVSLYTANYYENSSIKPTQAQEAAHFHTNRVHIANARLKLKEF